MGTSEKNCYAAHAMKNIIFLLLLCLIPHAALAEKSPPPKKAFSLEKLQNTYKKALSLEADLLQEVYQASLGRTKTSRGSLKLAKPNLARWEIYEPEASVMVSDGLKLSYFTPDARGKGKGQVIERKAVELQKQPLFRILTGASSLDKDFHVEKETEWADGKGTELVLKPTKKLGDIVEVRLRVGPKYLIQELITETEAGNKTKITLQNQVLGAKLPPALFAFKPPAGTEVLQH
jgi:outer membrane lipoprotein carrier protein